MTALLSNDHWQLTSLGLLIAWTLTATAAWSLAAALVCILQCPAFDAVPRHRVWAISMVVVLLAPLFVLLLASPLLPAHRWWKLPDAYIVPEPVATSAPQLSAKAEPTVALQANSNAKPIHQSRHRDEYQARKIAVAPFSPAHITTPISSVASAAPTIQPEQAAFHWIFWLLAVWLMGAAIRAMQFVWAMWQVRRLRAGTVELTGSDETRLLAEICRQLRIRRTVRLLVSPCADVPLLSGLFIPAVILPVGHGRWPANRLWMVLVHELIHLKRRDVVWEIVAQLATLPVWFHPLAWLAARRMRIERELACDDAVLMSGATATDYAEQLVEVAAEMRGKAPVATAAVAMAGASPIERRVRSILDPRTWRAPLGRWRTIGLVACMASLVAVVAILSPASGDESKPTTVARPTAIVAAKAASPTDGQIMARLGEPTTLQIANVPLEDALSALSSQCHIPIAISIRSFVNTGAELSPTVTASSAGNSLRQVIDSLIHSGFGDKARAEISAKKGILEITAAGVERPTVFRSEPGAMRQTVVYGTLLTDDGKPAAGYPIIARLWWQTIAMQADDDGRFAIPMLADDRGYFGLTARNSDGTRRAAQTINIDIPYSQEAPPNSIKLEKTRVASLAVVDVHGKPVRNAHASITGMQGAYDPTQFSGLTDSSGRFSAVVPQSFQVGFAYAFKSGDGLDYRSYVAPRTSDLHAKTPLQPSGEIELRLTGTRTVKIKCVDEDGKPLAGAVANVRYFTKPGETSDLNGGGPWRASADSQGAATFDWLPTWQELPLTFWVSPPHGLEADRERASFRPNKDTGKPLVVTLHRMVELGGNVTDSSGKPVPDATVELNGKGYSFRSFRAVAKSDRKGQFRIAVPPLQRYMLAARSGNSRLASVVHSIAMFPSKPINSFNLKLVPTARVFGRATVGPTNTPAGNLDVEVWSESSVENGKDYAKFPHKPEDFIPAAFLYWHSRADAPGRFEFRFAPGEYRFNVRDFQGDPQFSVTNQNDLEINIHCERDIPTPHGILHGTIFDGIKPVAGATVDGVAQPGGDVSATTDANGAFDVSTPLAPATLFVSTKDRSRAGILLIKSTDRNVKMSILPVANESFRILDENKKPYSTDRKFTYGVEIIDDPTSRFRSFQWQFGDVIQPDRNGILHLKGLAVGATYVVELHDPDGHSYNRATTITPKEPGAHDLGDIVFEQPKPYHPPTLDEEIRSAFGGRKTAVRRNDDARAYTRLADARVLVTFADPKAPLTKQLFGLYSDGEVSNTMYDEYRTVEVSLAHDKWNQAGDLAKQLGVWYWKELPLIVAESSDGEVLGSLLPSQLAAKKNPIDRATLLAFMKQHAVPRRDGTLLLQEALARAKRENKRVIADETAVWCGPCHRLAVFLDKHRALWEKDYLWIKMDQRWPHSDEIMKSLRRKSDRGGIPWVAILDADGNVIGQNLGFPGGEGDDDIDHFVELFKSTSQRMTADDLAQLKKALEAANR